MLHVVQTGKAMRNPLFPMNPQFRMEVVAPQNEDEEEGVLIVGLMQKDDRMKRIETGIDLNYIGYCIFARMHSFVKVITTSYFVLDIQAWVLDIL